jgi:hypothetical protein
MSLCGKALDSELDLWIAAMEVLESDDSDETIDVHRYYSTRNCWL